MVDKLFIMGYFMGYLYKIIYISQMRKLTIQLLGYIGWIHDFLLSNGCWFGLYIYIHDYTPSIISMKYTLVLFLHRYGETFHWVNAQVAPLGSWFPSSPKMGWMDGAKNTYGWILEEHIMNYYELVYLICYIYVYILHIFFMCHVLLEGLTCWWQRICSGFFGRTIGRVFYNLHQCRGRTNSGDTACRGSTEVSVCIISKERSSQARIWILQQWQALPYQRKRNQLPKFQTAFTFPCLVDTVKPSQSWPPQHPQPWRAIPWGQTVVFPPFFPIVSAT